MNNDLKLIESKIDEFLIEHSNQLNKFATHLFQEISAIVNHLNLESITITFEEREMFWFVPKFDIQKMNDNNEIKENELSKLFEKISLILYKMNYTDSNTIIIRTNDVLIS